LTPSIMLKLIDVSFFYNKGLDAEVRALSDINITFNKGEFISIIGPNGGGKSTLAHLLNGLILPHEGEVLVDGVSTAQEENLFPIRQKVGLLFENPDSQIVAGIVEEDIAFGPENLGLDREEIAKRITDSLRAVGMEAYRAYEPHTLSAGQKQKVALASVLAMQPSYLVLDEPTAYLDPDSRLEVLNLLKNINSQDIAVINITHNREEISYSQRVIVIENSRLVFDGSVREFFGNGQILKTTGFED